MNMLDPTRLTADLALTLALMALALRLSPRGEQSVAAWRCWTAAAAVYLLHVAFAFHFVHGWSHADALSHTAERTAAVFGIATGAGLWVNYAFTVAWLADVLMWRLDQLRALRADAPRPMWLANLRAPVIRITWIAFFLFMAFNATLVFEGGATRAYFAALFAAASAYVIVQRVKPA